MSLAKSFDPQAVEQPTYARWEAAGWFAAGSSPGRPAFCIQLPPPNVTGVLHMGHAFNQTIMDALTRYHRMRGYNTLWQAGTDHAGIATQIVVERQLEQENSRLSQIQKDQKMLKEEVDEEDIAQVVAKWTGIPVSRLMEGEIEKLVHMEERLHQRVIGQDDAVRRVSEAVRRARAGLQDPRRPLGSFLFLGPTGVGKTELARALAEFLFDDEKAMVRIDMSEYQEKHTVARMIGAPPGYIGFEEGGALTEAVRRRPFSVLLLDEVEKAHPEVLNVLLQLLDDGRLTDGQGRTVDFRNTIVIMTSNLGSQWILELGEDDREEMERRVQESLREHFRPEFLNRVDEVIVFHSLTRADIRRIVDLQIQSLQNMLAEREMKLILTETARDALAEEGYDPHFGARPLKRTIQRRLQNPLAMKLLAGEFKPGQTIEVGVENGEFVFRAAKPKPAREKAHT